MFSEFYKMGQIHLRNKCWFFYRMFMDSVGKKAFAIHFTKVQ